MRMVARGCRSNLRTHASVVRSDKPSWLRPAPGAGRSADMMTMATSSVRTPSPPLMSQPGLAGPGLGNGTGSTRSRSRTQIRAGKRIRFRIRAGARREGLYRLLLWR